MLKRILLATTLSVGALAGFHAGAAKHEPYNRSRIYWDASTTCYPLPGSGNYGRMNQLLDGRLMVVGRYNDGLYYSLSSDYGKTWETPVRIIKHITWGDYASPDFKQLADGTILVGLNPRPSAGETPEHRYGMSVLRSTDLGKTWSDPIFIYDADWRGENGCWEPHIMQLPSGEVHYYFSDEGHHPDSNDQEIMMCRSFDNGLTWTEPVRVCYRKGHRDGMASAIITKAGEIVFTVEDNGHPGYNGMRATTMRCTLEQNWYNYWVDANSPNRNMIFEQEKDKRLRSAGPYLVLMPNGETACSWMGEKAGLENCDLDHYPQFVAVGDENARNFKAVDQSLMTGTRGCATWGSLGVADDGYLYAMANHRVDDTYKGLGLVKGRPAKGMTAAYGTPKLDALPTKDAWAYEMGRQLTMGAMIMHGRVEMDFLYDRDNFYIYAYVQDSEIYNDKVDNDGVFLYLDLEGCCDQYPQAGEFRFFFNVDGTVELRRGNNGKWQPAEDATEGVQYVLRRQTKYYMFEAAIPWSLMGYDGPKTDKQARINASVRDRNSKGLATQVIPDAEDRASWTWPELYFGEDAGVEAVVDNRASQARINVRGNLVDVEGEDATLIALYTTGGALVASSAGNSLEIAAPGLYIVEARFADGSAIRRKLAI